MYTGQLATQEFIHSVAASYSTCSHCGKDKESHGRRNHWPAMERAFRRFSAMPREELLELLQAGLRPTDLTQRKVRLALYKPYLGEDQQWHLPKKAFEIDSQGMTLEDLHEWLCAFARQEKPKEQVVAIGPLVGRGAGRRRVEANWVATDMLNLDCDGAGSWKLLLEALRACGVAMIYGPSGSSANAGRCDDPANWHVHTLLSEPIQSPTTTVESGCPDGEESDAHAEEVRRFKAGYGLFVAFMGALAGMHGVGGSCGFDTALDSPTQPLFPATKRQKDQDWEPTPRVNRGMYAIHWPSLMEALGFQEYWEEAKALSPMTLCGEQRYKAREARPAQPRLDRFSPPEWTEEDFLECLTGRPVARPPGRQNTHLLAALQKHRPESGSLRQAYALRMAYTLRIQFGWEPNEIEQAVVRVFGEHRRRLIQRDLHKIACGRTQGLGGWDSLKKLEGGAELLLDLAAAFAKDKPGRADLYRFMWSAFHEQPNRKGKKVLTSWQKGISEGTRTCWPRPSRIPGLTYKGERSMYTYVRGMLTCGTLLDDHCDEHGLIKTLTSSCKRPACPNCALLAAMRECEWLRKAWKDKGPFLVLRPRVTFKTRAELEKFRLATDPGGCAALRWVVRASSKGLSLFWIRANDSLNPNTAEWASAFVHTMGGDLTWEIMGLEELLQELFVTRMSVAAVGSSLLSSHRFKEFEAFHKETFGAQRTNASREGRAALPWPTRKQLKELAQESAEPSECPCDDQGCDQHLVHPDTGKVIRPRQRFWIVREPVSGITLPDRLEYLPSTGVLGKLLEREGLLTAEQRERRALEAPDT